MPTARELRLLNKIPGARPWADRIGRRFFPPLGGAPLVQGKLSELSRIARRLVYRSTSVSERLAYEANDWLMRTMAEECHRTAVTAVHSYEDCSLWQFEEASRLGKACVYDMPIGYYPAWQEIEKELLKDFSEWLPSKVLPARRFVRPEQKRREMELADLVLAPSQFVRDTIANFVNKRIELAPYGIDTNYWKPATGPRDSRLTFLHAGQLSVRKGTPLLLEAWCRAELKEARLVIIGQWQLCEARKNTLPKNCEYIGMLPAGQLRDQFQKADVFVLPTFFEGRALVGSEALACGLPLVTTVESGLSDLVDDHSGKLVPAGDLDGLVAVLRWFEDHHDQLGAMKAAARNKAENASWIKYRQAVDRAVATVL